MSKLTLEAKLERVDSNTPWGFRMQGGKDFSSPLTIQKVIDGSLAAKCGLQQGDIIMKIGEADADDLKHKEAQHSIVQSGNKLALLLQRKNLERYMDQEGETNELGAAPVQRQYETFATPTYSQKPQPTFSSPAYGTPSSANAYKNQTARPFGVSPGVNQITQQTQKMTFTPKPVDLQTAAERYADHDEKPLYTAHQSKSFKVLDDILSGSQEPPPSGSALKPLPTSANSTNNRRTPSPQPGVTPSRVQGHSTFNTPIGLYSSENANNAYKLHRNSEEEKVPDSSSSGTDSDVDQFGRKIYRPSETFLLVQEEDSNSSKEEESVKPIQSRTLKMLQQQLGTGEAQQAPPPPRAPPAMVSAQPQQAQQLDLAAELAAERLSDALAGAPTDLPKIKPLLSDEPPPTIDIGPVPAPVPEPAAPVPEQEIVPAPIPAPEPEPVVQPEQVVKPEPEPVVQPEQVVKPEPVVEPKPVVKPVAPKPATWAPPKQPQAPAAKPFVPTVQPAAPAPGGPRAPPPKPSGVGAVRGKKGDVTVFKAGDAAPGGTRIPVCNSCGSSIRGPFVVALQKTWCPDHFVCANPQCNIKLLDIGFVEEGGFLYCEKDYEQFFAPHCAVCGTAIVGECVNALNKTYHPNCFKCHQCKQPIGGNQFHLEDGNAYCENDWKQMFQTMCKACEFPIEPGDRWVEAMNNNFHSECFNCSTCQVNLEGQPFYAKAGKPYCKQHAR